MILLIKCDKLKDNVCTRDDGNTKERTSDFSEEAHYTGRAVDIES